jgi:hypothetical protein
MRLEDIKNPTPQNQMMNSELTGPKKHGKMSRRISWVFSTFFFMAFVGSLFSSATDTVDSVCYFLLGVILLPFANDMYRKQLGTYPNRKIKTVLIMILFFVTGRQPESGSASKISQSSTTSEFATCLRSGENYFKEIGSWPKLSDGRLASRVAEDRCRNTTSAFGDD